MKAEKLQVINRTWNFFYGKHILDLGILASEVPRSKVLRTKGDEMETFRKQCDEHDLQHYQPQLFRPN